MRSMEMSDDWLKRIDPDSPEWMFERQRETIEAYRGGDLDWVLEQTDPEVEIVQPPEIPGARSYKGHEGLIDSLLDWPREWDDFRVEPKRIFSPSADQVIVHTVHHGRSRTMGIEVDADIVWLFTLRDGRTRRWEMFLSLDAALDAAARSG
jgi:ketosteroid isomerase-like protein